MTKIKPKQIFKRTLALLISVLICVTGIPLTAFSASVNINGLPGTPGSGYVEGTGAWYDWQYGARVTLVDATTGYRVPGYMSIDYTSSNYVSLPGGATIPIENAVHFGKWCKSDYRAGRPLTAANGGYERVSPPAALDTDGNIIAKFPRMLNGGDGYNDVSVDKVKEYFGNGNVIEQFAMRIGASYEEVISGKYKFLVEPLACISLPSINEAYVATITELAIYDQATGGYIVNKWGSSWLPKNWSKSLFLKEDDIGYKAWRPTTGGVSDDTIIDELGLITISFDADDATVYHHICNVKLNIPKGAP